MKQKMYLVTGAAGFLGGTICRQLIQRGDKVRAFVLPNDKAMKYVPQEAEIVEGDVCDLSSLERFFDVPKDIQIIVLHIASIVTVNPEYNQKVIDVNVKGTQNIIDFCLQRNDTKLVYCGSTGAIPELPNDKQMKEIDHFEPEKVLGCYSQSKAMASQIVLDAVAQKNLDACIVMPTGIMGPEDFAVGETTKVLIQIIKGEMPIGIAGSFNLSDVRDLANGVILAADKAPKGNSYILGNDVVSFKDFSKIVSDEAGCGKVKFFIPTSIAHFIAKMAEKKAKKDGTRPLMTTFSVYNLAKNNKFDSSKAKNELGYTTRSYQETMKDEIQWLKNSGKIA